MNYWEAMMDVRYRSLFGSNVQVNRQFDMYVQGLIDGIEAHAIHKDGQRLCGALQRPLQEVRNEILTASRAVLQRYR